MWYILKSGDCKKFVLTLTWEVKTSKDLRKYFCKSKNRDSQRVNALLLLTILFIANITICKCRLGASILNVNRLLLKFLER